MGEGTIPDQVVVCGENTIQTSLLADLLRSNLRGCSVVLDDIGQVDNLLRNGGNKLVLVDSSVVTEEELESFLNCVTAHQDQLFVAIFNVTRDEPHDHYVDRPEIRGIIYGDSTQDVLVKGVTALLGGELWFGRDLVNSYLHRHRCGNRRPDRTTQSPLTNKELQILGCVVNGQSNKEIARRLHISDGTVKTHVYNIFKKIQVRNRVQAANWFLQHTSCTDGLTH